MSTENQQTEVVQTQETKTEQTQERQYSEIELKAIEQGWIPKDEFDGDESEFIDAPEFVRRGELFSKIESQSKELKKVREALEAFKVHHTKVKEMEYERALKALKDARRQAVAEGEHERALALEDKIDEVKAEKEQIIQEANSTQPESDDSYSPEFTSWVDRNPWYETNKVMRKTADALGKEFYDAGHSPAEVLVLVEKEIRKEFAHKFQNPATKRPSAVEGSTRQSAKKDNFELTAEEREIMRKIVAVTPGFTEADYIKDIKALRQKN